MRRNEKIILSAVVAIAAISTLFAVVPTSGTFITSYIFAVIAICGIAGTIFVYGKGNSKAVAGLSYIYTCIVYAIVSLIFSIIACLVPLAVILTLVVHIILLALFAVRIITSSAGSDYVNDADKRNEEKHNNFLNEKKDYWK